jgi:choline dehydrogenase
MQTEHDLSEMREGIRLAHEIFHQKAFDEYRGKEINPGNVDSDTELNEFIKNKGDTAYHPCGTCKMGKDNTSVVNEKLQVYGVENLRVVDASIMPKIITGNLNATTVMIAEKASDYILGKSLKTNNVEFFRAG